MRDETYVERYGYGNTGMVANIHDRVLGFSAFESDGVAKGVVEVTGAKISLQDLMALSRTDGSEQARIAIPEDVMLRLENSRAVIDGIVDAGAPVYGINTGFGLMSHTNIDKPDLALLQRNLITSHASGVGTPLDPNIVRRIMALRINTLCRGHSGVSLGTFNTLVKVFNAGLTPEVPCQGTVGASGDLAPLAHIALGCIGQGMMHDKATNTWGKARDLLLKHNIKPAVLQAKDGLSMVNGTQFITGVGSYALERGLRACQVAQPIMALSLVSLHGHINAFDARVHEAARPHAGAAVVGTILRGLVPAASHHITEHDVQDAYSLRCTPAVHGPALEAVAHLRNSLELEMNCSTDNPLIFAEDAICPVTGNLLPKVVSAGNFHGEYPAKALDTLALYVGELGRASAARIAMLVDPARNRGLPAFLGTDAGLDRYACTPSLPQRTLTHLH
jgi:histidine ammonia-lyase